jgi:hypothetical protein
MRRAILFLLTITALGLTASAADAQYFRRGGYVYPSYSGYYYSSYPSYTYTAPNAVVSTSYYTPAATVEATVTGTTVPGTYWYSSTPYTGYYYTNPTSYYYSGYTYPAYVWRTWRRW